MWLFLMQYKKVLAICIIPIFAVVALIGFEMGHGKGERSEPLAMNAGMKAYLEDNKEKSATPSPTEAHTAKAAESPKPDLAGLTVEAVKDIKTPLPTQNSTATPKRTAAPQSKATSKPKETQNSNSRVNINTASADELMSLKGIGESKAKAILAYRAAQSFQTIEDLMKVKGIGPKIFANIEAQLEL